MEDELGRAEQGRQLGEKQKASLGSLTPLPPYKDWPLSV
jgi:hypothetical protein